MFKLRQLRPPRPRNVNVGKGYTLHPGDRPNAVRYNVNGMVWYGMVYVNLYSAIVANVSNALGTLVPGKQPSFRPCLPDRQLSGHK